MQAEFLEELKAQIKESEATVVLHSEQVCLVDVDVVGFLGLQQRAARNPEVLMRQIEEKTRRLPSKHVPSIRALYRYDSRGSEPHSPRRLLWSPQGK
jgi:hypothetical protein